MKQNVCQMKTEGVPSGEGIVAVDAVFRYETDQLELIEILADGPADSDFHHPFSFASAEFPLRAVDESTSPAQAQLVVSVPSSVAIAPNQSDVLVARLRFRAKALSGTAEVLTSISFVFTAPGTPRESHVIIDDGLGTDELMSATGVMITVDPDWDDDGISDDVDTDDDGDGMPDDWEDSYELDPYNASDASQDADGDGTTNLQEFQNGTDPTVPDDVPAVPALTGWATALLAAALWAIGAVIVRRRSVGLDAH